MTRSLQPKSFVVVDLNTLTETSDGDSVAFRSDGDVIVIAADVTVFSGTTETLDLEIHWSGDGTTFAVDPAGVDAFPAQILAVGQHFARFPVKAPLWRLNYAIGGTGVDLDFKVNAILV
jgi:hypothetical protein